MAQIRGVLTIMVHVAHKNVIMGHTIYPLDSNLEEEEVGSHGKLHQDRILAFMIVPF